MNEKKSKNIIIIALCITLIFMGVGFSLLTQTLTVNTTATVRGSWDVHFKSFTDSTSSLASTNTTNQGENKTAANILAQTGNTNTTVHVDFDLFKPGDQVQYTGVIKNYGNIAAVLTTYSATFDSSVSPSGYITRTVTINGQSITTGANDAVTSPSLTLAADDGNESAPEDDEATVVITYEFDKSKTDFPTPNAKSNSELENNDIYQISDTIVFGFTQANNG